MSAVSEIWHIRSPEAETLMTCRCFETRLADGRIGWLAEGHPEPERHHRNSATIHAHRHPGAGTAHVSGPERNGERTLYESLFRANTAPMLLIDPEREGAIVDANPTAVAFYGYPYDKLCSLHIWEINSLGRSALPIAQRIASWKGGHKPLHFKHRLADGSLRDVQTYAGPVEVDDRRLLLSIIHDITAQKETEHFNRLLLDSIHDGVFGIDLDGRFTFVNPAALHLLGYRHESELLNSHLRTIIPDANEAKTYAIQGVGTSGRALKNHEEWLIRGDGVQIPTLLYAAPIARARSCVGVVVSFSDLTEQKAREAQVIDLANSFPGVVFQMQIDANGQIDMLFVSAGLGTLLGLLEEPDLRNPIPLLATTHPDDQGLLSRSIQRAVRGHHPWQCEWRVNTPQGVKWLLGRSQPRQHTNGSTLFNGVLIDITERKTLEAELQYAAHHDPLTGTWNRRYCETMLQTAHAQTERYGTPYSLIMLDIDRFKSINDTFGHDVGDLALTRLTQTLSERLRKTDELARWGGEEFMVLLPNTKLRAAVTVAETVRTCVASLRIPPLTPFTVSLGVAEAEPEEPLQSLLKRVDDALLEAKAQGRNRVLVAEYDSQVRPESQ
ncbi:diguanylate cyclase [Thiorhodococcus fuscus]|uniref:diguanylate cyclase n=1 Tax=Thiorhodococcus fuscus TaxID=527200 RepID=A0ABW4Y6Z8_9GAMM